MIFHYLNAETTFIQFKFRAAHIANALALYHVAHLSFVPSLIPCKKTVKRNVSPISHVSTMRRLYRSRAPGEGCIGPPLGAPRPFSPV
jgi:hypothetical protein